MFLSLQAFFHEKSSSLAKAGQGWSTSAASASLCRSEHKWGSNFMSEQQSRGMSAILNEDWENNLGSVHQETWDSLKKTHMCMYIHSYWHDYIYMFLLLDGDNDKLPIVGMARGSSFFSSAGRMWWSPKAVPIRKGLGGMGANHW